MTVCDIVFAHCNIATCPQVATEIGHSFGVCVAGGEGLATGGHIPGLASAVQDNHAIVPAVFAMRRTNAKFLALP